MQLKIKGLNIIRLFYISLLCVVMITVILISMLQSLNNVKDVLAKMGSKGTQVTQIQQKLQSQGFYRGTIDGIYGKLTEQAVTEYQQKYRLKVDGIAGPETLRALGITLTSQANGSQSLLKFGSRENEVTQIQQKLQSQGFYRGAIDGIYGKLTEQAVIAYQQKNRLRIDGIVGPETLGSLGIASGAPSAKRVATVSSNDTYILAKMVSAEARGESFLGQIAVAAVIVNRLKHPSFPNTISGVLYEPGAFTAVTDGQYYNEPIYESAYRAADAALKGLDPTGGAIYYFNPNKTANKFMWGRPVITIIGSHRFCA